MDKYTVFAEKIAREYLEGRVIKLCERVSTYADKEGVVKILKNYPVGGMQMIPILDNNGLPTSCKEIFYKFTDKDIQKEARTILEKEWNLNET